MNDEQNQELKLHAKVRSALDADLDQLDPSIIKRLRESRQQAVDLADKRPFRLFTKPWLVPIGSAAMLAFAVVGLSLWSGIYSKPFPNNTTEEIEVLTVQGNLEMYKDLDFFQMLAQTHETR